MRGQPTDDDRDLMIRLSGLIDAKAFAYAERNELVALLSRLWPAHLAPATDAQPGWLYVVCVHTPAGQAAWRVSDADANGMFAHLSMDRNDWDGHSTLEKYARLRQIGAEEGGG